MAKYTEFGIKAKIAMVKKQLRLSDVAKELGICVPYLCEIFKGSRKGKKQIPKIKKLLDI